jgi:CubicO group peptidase (beta-lactamase class C family)
MLEQLVSLCEAAIATRVTPGGVLYFGNGSDEFSLPFGTTTYEAGSPVSEETIYDIASLTKPMATAAIAMSLVADGSITLDLPLAELIPGVAPTVRIFHLLGHGAGYPAHRRYFTDMKRCADARDELVRRAVAEPLEREPGVKAVYSDLGYILLGRAFEVQCGMSLDQLFKERVAEPVGLSNTSYVDLDAGQQLDERFQVAPTERYPDRGLATGEGHDENAYVAGGVLGHAGLFATAGDVAKFGAAMCASWHGEGPLDQNVVREFFQRSAAPDTSWRLGWDTPSPTMGVSHAGDRWPRDGAVGHLAFTGCSLWLHPQRRWVAAFLSNRVHPHRDGDGIKDLRRGVMDEITGFLESCEV